MSGTDEAASSKNEAPCRSLARALRPSGGRCGRRARIPGPGSRSSDRGCRVTAVGTSLNSGQCAHLHQVAAGGYHELRNKSRIFREITMATIADDTLLARGFAEVAALRDELNKTSPQISRWAFLRARDGIEEGETTYAIDKPRDDSIQG